MASLGHYELKPEQNGWYFPDYSFKCVLLDELFYALIKISVKFVPVCPIGNNLAMVQIMVWGQTGAKPLPQQLMAQFIDTYGSICLDVFITELVTSSKPTIT